MINFFKTHRRVPFLHFFFLLFFALASGAQEVDLQNHALSRDPKYKEEKQKGADVQKKSLENPLPSNASFDLVDRIVAIVNSEIILESDFKGLLKTLARPDFVDEVLLDGKMPQDLITSKELQLKYLMRERLMDSEVRRLSLSVTSDRVDQEISDIGRRNGISSEEVLRAIKDQGMPVADYRDFLKTKIERQSLIENEIISRLRISDDDTLSEYLKNNPRSTSSVDEFSVAHVFFSPKKSGAAAALERAQNSLLKIRQGEKFETVAEQTSEDPNFSNGGFLGTFKSGEFMKEIEESVSTLQPGDISSIVKSRMGFHIVKLINKKLTVDPKYEKEKDRIKSQLMDQAFRRQMVIWFQNKMDEAFVKVNEYKK